MKAIRISEFGEPSVMKLIKDFALPSPSEDQVMIEVKYAGVNPVDTYRRSGKYQILPPLPWVPGSDCSGVITDIGSKLQGKFVKGQRVYTTSTISGSYASHALVSVEHLHLLSDKISWQQGAALGVPYYTAYRFLFHRGEAKPGETVLVHGASGAVGIACIELAKANNMTVIGTAGTKEGLELIKKVGADYVFNHREDNYVEQILAQFDGKINLILEMLADKNLTVDCKMAAFGGRIMIIGSRGSINFEPRSTMRKALDIRGDALFNNTPEEWNEAENRIHELIENGAISPVIWREYELSDAPQAHHDIIFNSGTLGKLVLKI